MIFTGGFLGICAPSAGGALMRLLTRSVSAGGALARPLVWLGSAGGAAALPLRFGSAAGPACTGAGPAAERP